MKTTVLSLLAILTLSFTYLANRETNLGENSTAEKSLIEDNYRVIKVNGQILYIKSGKNMSQGDVFSPREQLEFKTDESRAAVISKTAGRKILSPKTGTKTKATLLPAMNNISSRAGALINLIDLKNHFAGNYLVLDEIKLQISSKSFPMDQEKFFFIRYDCNGETINKKLEHDGEKLIINKKELFKVDGEPIESDLVEECELYYREGKKSTLIGSFKPIFPETEALKSELSIIMSELKGKEEDEVIEELTSYLNEYYGKPDKDNLKEWLSANFE